MPNEKKGVKKWADGLRHTYRMVIMNDETFEEISSYKLTMLNVYTLISTIMVLVALLVVALIIGTPLKRYIPGYGDVKERAELMRLQDQLNEMEQQLLTHQAYSDNFRRILVGEIEPVADEPDTPFDQHDSLLIVERIEEDELLRQEIEFEELLQESFSPRKTTNYSPKDVPLQQLYFIPPINGEVSANFMYNKKHFGVDVMAPKNTPCKSSHGRICHHFGLDPGNRQYNRYPTR